MTAPEPVPAVAGDAPSPPSASDADEALELGRAIRERRGKLGFTAARLAEAAGVSRSLVSQVERGHTSPSITTLRRIAAALGVPVVALFAGASAGSSSFDRNGRRVVTRSFERKTLFRPGSANVVYELLTPDLEGSIEFMRIEVGPHTTMPANEPSQHAGEEHQFCLEGAYTLLVDGEQFAVSEGDSISFDSGKPHQLFNRADSRVVLVTAISPVNF